MVFENDKIRIGPTGAQKELFMMPGRNGIPRKGKRQEIPIYLANLGLNAYEFPGGRMTKMSDSPKYEQFRKNAVENDVAISLHAPYYISLTSEDPDVYERSIERIAHSYAWAVYLNASRIVLHPGTYGFQAAPKGLDVFLGKEEKSQLAQKKSQIIEGITRGIALSKKLYPDFQDNFNEICLCPETMGKSGQFGTVREILELCKNIGLQKTRPCIDFGHIFARNLGKIPEARLYREVFDYIESELGSQVAQYLHIHYSVIEWTPKGEKKHHGNQIDGWGPHIDPLFELIRERGYTPIIINESPELEPDAVLLMDQWKSSKRKN